MGYYNRPQGSSSSYSSMTVGDRLLIIGNGNPTTQTNAFEVSNNGHSIVYHTNGTGAVNGAIIGARYEDNTIYAWGDISAGGGINYDFGVGSVSVDSAVGNPSCPTDWTYTIHLNLVDPYTGNPRTLAGGAVTATLESANCEPADIITASPIHSNYFTVKILETGSCGCHGVQQPFMFHVCGRPNP